MKKFQTILMYSGFSIYLRILNSVLDQIYECTPLYSMQISFCRFEINLFLLTDEFTKARFFLYR